MEALGDSDYQCEGAQLGSHGSQEAWLGSIEPDQRPPGLELRLSSLQVTEVLAAPFPFPIPSPGAWGSTHFFYGLDNLKLGR